MAERLPQLLVRLSGAFVAVAAVALYFHLGYAWWLLVVLVLVPDLSMLGYLAGPRGGAVAYDIAHTYALPVGLATVGVVLDVTIAIEVGLIWLLHIGFDRALGYGLKYPSSFKDTHIQRI